MSWRHADLTAGTGDTRRQRSDSARRWSTYRDWPDGADGLYWLEGRPGRACGAHHAPFGEAPHLSVAFSVDGPMQARCVKLLDQVGVANFVPRHYLVLR